MNIDPGKIPRVEFLVATPERFFEERAKSKRLEFLSELTLEELAERRLFLSRDSRTGYLLDRRGDFGNLFNNGGVSGAGQAAIVEAIQRSALTLDCFDPGLPKLYANFGFQAVYATRFDDRFAPRGWPVALGKPDIISMAYAGGPRATISSRVGTFAPYHHPQVWSSLDEARARARAVALALDVHF